MREKGLNVFQPSRNAQKRIASIRLGALIALLTCALAGGRVPYAQSLVVAATHQSRFADYGLRRFARLLPASAGRRPARSTTRNWPRCGSFGLPSSEWRTTAALKLTSSTGTAWFHRALPSRTTRSSR